MKDIKSNLPLVSIIVVTFNSAKYVLETLESAKSQTYQNIELIISDDGSKDDTVAVCTKWLTENKESFTSTKLITVPKNTGITANCNRGLKASNGEWIKLIAGDDALLPESIQDNFDFIINNSNAQIVHSKKLIYKEHFQKDCFLQESLIENNPFNHSQTTASKQYELLLRKNHVVAPSAFIKASLLKKMNGFDERIPMIEDWPLWLKLTSAGYKIFFLNKATVMYRLHSESVSLPQDKQTLFSNHDQKLESIYNYYIYSSLPYIERLLYSYDFKRIRLFISLGLNKNTKVLKLLNKVTGCIPHLYRSFKLKSYR